MRVKKVDSKDDFEAIGNIYAESWKTAYQRIVPQPFLDGLNGTRWGGMLRERRMQARVILDEEKYAGVASYCPAREENMKGWGEIVSIYLLPEYFGSGYAEPLFRSVVKDILEMGYHDIFLWTLQENERAQKFYEKQGCQQNGDTAVIEIGGKELREVRYVRHFS